MYDSLESSPMSERSPLPSSLVHYQLSALNLADELLDALTVQIAEAVCEGVYDKMWLEASMKIGAATA